MTRKTLPTPLLALVALLGPAAGAAPAGMIPTSVSVSPDGGNFRWTYSVVLPTDMKLQAGDYFTIYDFGGMVPGTVSTPDGWQMTSTKLGPTPNHLNPQDDPNVTNVTFTYNGPTIPTGQIGLGNFMIDSLFQNNATTFFVATNPRAADGEIDQNITGTLAPTGSVDQSPGGGGSSPPPGVPEPATLALAGLGLPLIGAVRVVRRRKES
jgi:hypothetical protein